MACCLAAVSLGGQAACGWAGGCRAGSKSQEGAQSVVMFLKPPLKGVRAGPAGSSADPELAVEQFTQTLALELCLGLYSSSGTIPSFSSFWPHQELQRVILVYLFTQGKVVALGGNCSSQAVHYCQTGPAWGQTQANIKAWVNQKAECAGLFGGFLCALESASVRSEGRPSTLSVDAGGGSSEAWFHQENPSSRHGSPKVPHVLSI